MKMQSRRRNPVKVLGDVTERDGSIRKLVEEMVTEIDQEKKTTRSFSNIYRVFPNMKFLPMGDHEQDVIPCPHEAKFAFVLQNGKIEAYDLSKYPGDAIVDVLSSAEGYRIMPVTVSEGDKHGTV